MDLVFVSLGSKGNATLIRQGDTIIQIDMGVPLKEVRQGLQILNADVKDIAAVFITHEHADHIGGLPRYVKRDIPLYAGEGTLPGLPSERFLEEGTSVEIGEFTILPFSSSHDANNPMNFIIFGGGKKFGYVTDTGMIKKRGLNLLKNCDYYLMESNYGLKELLEGPYPPYLKRRIHGKHGHLSNHDGALYLSDLMGPRTSQVFLGHISLENNTPELAHKTCIEVLKEKGTYREDVKIIAVPQKTLQIGGDLL